MISKLWRKLALALVICLGIFIAVSCGSSGDNGDKGDNDGGGVRIAAFIMSDYMTYSHLGMFTGGSDINSIEIGIRSVDVSAGDSYVSGDVKVYAYGNEPKDDYANLVLEQYYYPGGGSVGASSFSVFKSTDKINPSVVNNKRNWGDQNKAGYVDNARAAVRVGGYLYFISNDVPRISKINLDTNEVVGHIDMPNIDDGAETYAAKGEDIVVLNGRIFALFGATNDSWNGPYADSVVVEVMHTDNDNAPTFGSQVRVGKNALGMSPVGNYIYVYSIGGKQQGGGSNGSESRIDRVTLAQDGITSETAIIEDAGDYDIYGFAVGNEYALIYRAQQHSTKPIAMSLISVKTVDLHNMNNEEINSTSSFEEIESKDITGWMFGILHDPIYDHFWVIEGGPVTVWNGDVDDFKSFTLADMGGSSASINSFLLFNGELGDSARSFAAPASVRSGSSLFNIDDELVE